MTARGRSTELVGTAVIAALLGVTRQRVLALAKTAGLPQPLAVLSMGKVRDGAELRRWAEHYTPRTRRA